MEVRKVLYEGAVSWQWLCKDKVRFWIFVGPSVCFGCAFAIFFTPLGSMFEGYLRLLPIAAFLSHVCPKSVFTRTPVVLFTMWLATAIFSLVALAVVAVEFVFPGL